ncbi:monovalent cation/H+ antiporter complex subunit F [Bdellovibrio sp. HCB117]|uniref:monovalent cation/H+ antiporter complex subunit F n=1 Tax=Bdellovibrio sp. HCB117 TaxID=3394359 RepID=UPI0039B42AF8
MMWILSSLLIIALALGTRRLLLGPTQADRAVVFDLLTAVLIAATVLIAIVVNDHNVMSLVIVLAVLSFVGTSLFAFYIEKTRGS